MKFGRRIIPLSSPIVCLLPCPRCLFYCSEQYAFALLLKAAGGTTLSQREARTLRRTAKDLVTVVPVVIILIIPLSPVRVRAAAHQCTYIHRNLGIFLMRSLHQLVPKRAARAGSLHTIMSASLFSLLSSLILIISHTTPPPCGFVSSCMSTLQVGHVLVFSFIQRIFPDFFPSPFTERRQNLMKLYDAIAPPPENDKYQKKK